MSLQTRKEGFNIIGNFGTSAEHKPEIPQQQQETKTQNIDIISHIASNAAGVEK